MTGSFFRGLAAVLAVAVLDQAPPLPKEVHPYPVVANSAYVTVAGSHAIFRLDVGVGGARR